MADTFLKPYKFYWTLMHTLPAPTGPTIASRGLFCLSKRHKIVKFSLLPLGESDLVQRERDTTDNLLVSIFAPREANSLQSHHRRGARGRGVKGRCRLQFIQFQKVLQSTDTPTLRGYVTTCSKAVFSIKPWWQRMVDTPTYCEQGLPHVYWPAILVLTQGSIYVV
jgi:hypothetical protein